MVLAYVTRCLWYRGKWGYIKSCYQRSALLVGSTISKVVGDINIVHPKRKDPANKKETKIVDNDDMIAALIHFKNGVHGHIGASRVTWGKKCGLTWEVHGTLGTITFDQERLNEIKLFTTKKEKYRRVQNYFNRS